jgi:hypothetical protein
MGSPENDLTTDFNKRQKPFSNEGLLSFIDFAVSCEGATATFQVIIRPAEEVK